MGDPVISVENLAKAYRVGLREEMPDTLVGAATSWLRAPWRNLRRLWRLNTFRGNEPEEKDIVWALNDISFEVQPGEVLGIIGRNGAGKSTLLKVLSRITDPTRGRAVIRGRVSCLLEVGTGFHPELTGRENVYMNGTILGMTKWEIDRRFDEIVEFSGVEKFLDTPIKRYSSGMQVRLAFAVAAHLDPEVLVIDEVLAVGDLQFQRKCLKRMQAVSSEGRTILFVSHNMAAVRTLCSRAILVNRGEIQCQGAVEGVVADYVKAANAPSHARSWPDAGSRPGNSAVRVHSVAAIPSVDRNSRPIAMQDTFVIECVYEINRPMNISTTLQLLTADGICLFGSNPGSRSPWHGRTCPPGVYRSECRIPGDLLNEGGYSVNLLFVEDLARVEYRIDNVIGFTVCDDSRREGAWFGRRAGLLAPRLQWECSHLGE